MTESVLDNPDALTLAERVMKELRHEIVTLRLAPGSKIDIRRTAARMGVSIIPVRETLRGLEAEGLVRIATFRNITVTPLSLEDMEATYSLRGVVEGLAIRAACERPTPAWLDGMRAAAMSLPPRAGLETPINDDQLLDSAERADSRFHLGIYAHCGSEPLRLCATMLYRRSERYRNFLRLHVTDPRPVNVGMRDVMIAIEAGEADLAASLMQSAIFSTVMRLRPLLAADQHLQIETTVA
ncbi:MAG: GntR family transcriptional regulator [Chloroflexi bacterium]|nr:GntR family transcriptional regulator [Chloroflexota bacterium]